MNYRHRMHLVKKSQFQSPGHLCPLFTGMANSKFLAMTLTKFKLTCLAMDSSLKDIDRLIN